MKNNNLVKSAIFMAVMIVLMIVNTTGVLSATAVGVVATLAALSMATSLVYWYRFAEPKFHA